MSVATATHRVLLPARIDHSAGLPAGEVFALAGACMGTTWQVRIAARASPTGLQDELAAVLERIEASMSHFRATSELSRFGRLAAGESMAISADFACVMHMALEVAHLSDGAFDPTLATEIDAWGFGAGKRYDEAGFCLPTVTPRTRTAWPELICDATVRLVQPGGVRLNLAAIAKGYAVDAVSEFLVTQGYPHHLVEVGGELRGAGMKPDRQPWWVALEHPAQECPLPATRIALHGLAVATSGDYRRRYRAGGRALQHTLDPRTCSPVGHGLASVTVIHESCMAADAWATAIMVAGPQDGLALAEWHDLCALLQWRDAADNWQEARSRAFRNLEQ